MVNTTSPALHVDYTIEAHDNLNCVRIILDPYKDITYAYEEIQASEEENPDGSINISFNLTFVNGSPELVNDDGFKNLAGNILLDVLIRTANDVIEESKGNEDAQN